MMYGHDTNPVFLNKKIMIGCPEHLPPLQPLCLITAHFCLIPQCTPHPSLQSRRHICITPKRFRNKQYKEYREYKEKYLKIWYYTQLLTENNQLKCCDHFHFYFQSAWMMMGIISVSGDLIENMFTLFVIKN